MTREEAIDILIREKDEDLFMRTEYRNKIHEALNMAIKALEQEHCEGCISRKDLLKKCVYAPIAPVIKGDSVHYEDIVFARDIINAEPIQQEPKTGHHKRSLSDGTLLTDTQWKIIHRIDVLYAKGKALKHIKKPIAWALYQVWKEVDEMESGDVYDENRSVKKNTR